MQCNKLLLDTVTQTLAQFLKWLDSFKMSHFAKWKMIIATQQ